MKIYKLLKKVESNSLPIGNKVELWEDCSLSSWWSIPTKRLVEHWYLELINDKMLVPNEIKFLNNDWNLVMHFNKKSLWYNHKYNDWFIGNYNTILAESLAIRCELVLTSYSNVEVWERYIREYVEDSKYFKEKCLYCLKIEEKKIVSLNNNKWTEITENFEDEWVLNSEVYRVVPLE